MCVFFCIVSNSSVVRQGWCRRDAFEYNNKCYYVDFGNVVASGYNAARQSCQCRGGHLATVADAGTLDFIDRVLVQRDVATTSNSFWIGLRNSCPPGGISYSQLQWEDQSCPVMLQATLLRIISLACQTCTVLRKSYLQSTPPSLEAIDCADGNHRHICEEPVYTGCE